MPRKPRQLPDAVLDAVLNTAVMRRVFRPLLPAEASLVSLHIDNRGKFEFKRAVLYKLRLRFPNGQERTWLVRGNVPSRDRRSEGPTGYHVLKTLWRKEFLRPPFMVAKPIAYVAHLRLLLYEHVPGTVLQDALRGSANVTAIFRDVGRWLKRLHHVKVSVGQVRHLTDVHQEAHYFFNDIRQNVPGALPRATPLLEWLVRALEQIWTASDERRCLTHGDLKPANMIRNGSSTVGIDFGNSLLADPCHDIGNFRAQLRLLSWRQQLPAQRLHAIDAAFLSGYGWPARPFRTDRRRLAAHEAWWTMQVLAYSLSTLPGSAAARLITPSLDTLERLLRVFGTTDAPWNARGAAFESFLESERWRLAFFRAHLNQFFPGADELLQLETVFPSAFSHDSRLVRMSLDLRLKDGTFQRRVVRGNRVGKANVAILETVRDRSSLPVQKPLWYNPASRFLFYEELPGTVLRAVPFRFTVLRPIVRSIGTALAELHQLPTRAIPALTLKNERRELRQYAKHIGSSTLPNKRLLQRLARQLERWETQHWTRLPQVIAHNDFQASNILLTPRGAAGFIDYSRSGRGALAIDAGQFLAHATVMLAPTVTPADRQRLRRGFLASYRARLPKPWRRSLERTLPAFELRAALDIIATSCEHLDTATRDRVLAPLFIDFPKPTL